MPDPAAPPRSRVAEVALYFTQLGFTAFGGPAAHVALMEQQLVHRRKWLDRQHFLDLVSAVNLIPGPNSTQLAISLGYLRAGWAGLVAAGVCFIVPAVLVILPVAWLYVRFGQTPHAAGALRGVNAAVLAVVAAAVFRLARTGLKDGFTRAVGVAALVLGAVGHWKRWPLVDLAVLATAALAGAAWYDTGRRRAAVSVAPLPLVLAASLAAPAGLGLMAALFLKIGSTLYGSGYLLVPYLRANFVEAHGWLSERQLLDAVAVGQVTPGPLLTTATFVGFLLGYERFGGGLGWAVAGALLATASIFFPSFVLVAALGPFLPGVRNHPAARGALDAMNAAVVALIAVTLGYLAPPVLHAPVNSSRGRLRRRRWRRCWCGA